MCLSVMQEKELTPPSSKRPSHVPWPCFLRGDVSVYTSVMEDRNRKFTVLAAPVVKQKRKKKKQSVLVSDRD